ncbi:hypothetical protein BS333_15235 [Vibrio azureus]|nr:tail fiber protein [Vibrio azureus]AUI87754.1 hypothetical protein BS333_15235 [Vibrio azureus]
MSTTEYSGIKEMQTSTLNRQAFTNSSPIDFLLMNPEGGPWEDHAPNTLFIVDVMGKTKVEQKLIIKNRSQYTIRLGLLEEEQCYHFRLLFRNGVFQSPYPPVFEEQEGWQIRQAQDIGDGSWCVDFICEYSTSLQPQDEFTFSFSYRTADALLGKRGTRMKICAQGMRFEEQAESFSTSVESQVDILNLSSNNAYISEIATQIGQYDSKTDDIEAALLGALYATKDDNEDNLAFANDLTKDMTKAKEEADGNDEAIQYNERTQKLNDYDLATKTDTVNDVISGRDNKKHSLRNKLDQSDQYGEKKFAKMKQLISLLVQHGIALDNEVDLKSEAYNAKFETLEAMYPLALSCETPTGLTTNQSSSFSVFLYNRSNQTLAFSEHASIKLIVPFGDEFSALAKNDEETGVPVNNSSGVLEKLNSSHNTSVFSWTPAVDFLLPKGDAIEIKIDNITPNQHIGRSFIDVNISGLIGQQNNTFSLAITKTNSNLARLVGNQNVGIGIDSTNSNNNEAEGIDSQSPHNSLDVQGDINTRSKIKELGNDLIPRGFIAMFYSDVIPEGWALCDGKNYTSTDGKHTLKAPDLRDRFIVGVGKGYKINNTGGANRVTLSIEQMPRHKHGISIHSGGTHTHDVTIDADKGEAGGTVTHGLDGSEGKETTNTFVSSKSGYHNHSATCDYSGNTHSHENRPPYYALCYIMKL